MPCLEDSSANFLSAFYYYVLLISCVWHFLTNAFLNYCIDVHTRVHTYMLLLHLNHWNIQECRSNDAV